MEIETYTCKKCGRKWGIQSSTNLKPIHRSIGCCYCGEPLPTPKEPKWKTDLLEFVNNFPVHEVKKNDN